MASITNITNQYKFAAKGPVDAKALVKTYAELLLESTWQVTKESGTVVNTAYNGMIVAVWLNKEDVSKNGVYFLHDSSITSILGTPNVSVESNWHKLGTLSDLQGLNEQIKALSEELELVKEELDDLQETTTSIVDTYDKLPRPGVINKLYVVTADAKSYIWVNDDYLAIGDGVGSSTVDIQVINGGGPSAT